MRSKLKIFIVTLTCIFAGFNAGLVYGQQAVTGMGGGTGTTTNPYQISTAAHLVALSNWVTASASNTCSATFFILMNDIDMSSVANFTPIGGRAAGGIGVIGSDMGTVFQGTFRGNNKVIRNLTINTTVNNNGLFGSSYGTIENLGFENCHLTTTGRNNGMVIGKCKNSGSLTNIWIKNSSVTTTGTDSGYTGMLVGEDHPTMTGCAVINCTLKAVNGNYIGGLVGDADGSTLIRKCYVTGSLIETSGCNYVGGVFGDSDKINARNCYVTNTTVRTLTANDNIGGFSGGMYASYGTTHAKCYSTAKVERLAGASSAIGGFIGLDNGEGTVTDCFYINTWNDYGLLSVAQGTMKTAAEMQAAAFVTTLNNSNEDGTNTWTSDNNIGFTRVNGGFPILTGVTSNTGTIPCPYYVSNGETMTIPSDYSGQYPCKIIVTFGGTLINNCTGFTDANMPELVIQDGGSFYNSTATNRKGSIELDLVAGKWNLRSHPFASATTLMPFSRDTATIGLDNMNSKRLLIAAHDYNFGINEWNSLYMHRTNEFPVKRGLFFWPYTSGGGVSVTAGSTVTCYMNGATYGNLYNETGIITIPPELLSAPVHTAKSATDGRWMPLGNPYPGRIYAGKFISENSGKIQGNAIYRWDPATSTWNTYTSSSQYIKAGEGFMVAINGSPSNYTFSKNHMIMAQVENRRSTLDVAPIYLAATANSITKQAYLKFDKAADNGFDSNDAYALFGKNENVVEPYFAVDGESVVINAFCELPYITPVNMHAAKAGAVKLEMSNIPAGMEATLIDLKHGTSQRLDSENAIYETFVESGENQGRFVLTLNDKNTTAAEIVEQVLLDYALQAYVPYVGNKNIKFY